jgi:hypothetical protein
MAVVIKWGFIAKPSNRQTIPRSCLPMVAWAVDR